MRILGALLLLLLIPSVMGAINDARPFEAPLAFMEGTDGDTFTVVSGELEVRMDAVVGPFGFFDADGIDIEGLDRVCWRGAGSGCIDEGRLTIRVLPGGSAGIDFPGAADAVYTARHALGLFVDYEGDEDLNSFNLGKTLTAPAVGGLVDFGDIQDIPFSRTFNFGVMGGLVALSENTTVQVLDGGSLREQFQGKSAALSFEGSPSVAPFASDFVVLPFEDDSEATFRPASSAAADEGLHLERISALLSDLDAANEGNAGQEQEVDEQAEDFQDVLAEVLNGALLRVPTGGSADFEEVFLFANFDVLRIRSDGERLASAGLSPLSIRNGEVAGAPELIGFAFFALPWWSYLLWAIGIGVFVARLIVKPDKEHDTWDRYRWIGWVFGAVASIILFLLWDFEVRSIWGTSLLSTDAGGAGLLLTLAVQLGTLLFVLFAVAAPLRLIFRNGLLLARQGSFMGLSGGVAALLAYALGATLLLSYIELIVVAMLEQAGG